MHDGACYTHMAKNAFKYGNEKVSKLSCRCGTGGRAVTSKNHRFTPPLPRKLHKQFYYLMHKAVSMYLHTGGHRRPHARRRVPDRRHRA